MCRPIITDGAELCDNVDNDCNGLADDGAGLCPALKFVTGLLRRSCGTGEFRCLLNFRAKAATASKTPAPVWQSVGQACRNGTCRTPATASLCPVAKSASSDAGEPV